MIRHVFLLVALFVVVSHGHPTTSSSIVVVDPTSATTATAKVTDAAVEAKTPDNNKPEDVGSSTKHLKPKVTSMHVESNVTLRYAKTLVTSRVSNPASKANEVTFSVVIPETAFITGFSMEIDGKVYEAYVKEKAEAKKVYQAAVNSGYAAAHVAVQARDSNHFTVSVNVEPESKAIFRLTYEELLYRRLGLYNLVMNINPGQLLEDLSVDVNIDESAPIKGLFVPQLRTGNEVDAEEGDAENQFSTIDISEDKLRATVHFAPNKTQQLELMRIFKEREHQTTTPSNSYNPFEPIPRKVASDEDGLKGQFVVQYDVDRDVKGEILLNDGYFVHFFAPTDLKPLNKHVIFVLDVSGSMVGRKVAQLKEAMNSILSDLLPGDWFSIIDFSYSANVYDLDNTSRNSQFHQSDRYYFGEEMVVRKEPEIPPPPKPATPENIAKAKVIIDQLVATGGTNIHDALTVALRVANRGIQLSANETETVPKPLPSPMIIFLTDGEPTVGDTNLDNILTAVKDINTKKVALFSLAFGEDADRGFLRRVSLQNNGFMRHIYEAADAAQQLRHFYKQVASPLLANVTLTYPQDQIDEDSLTKKTFNYFFLGSELVIAGRTKSKEGDTALVLPHAPNFKLEASSFGGPIDFIPIVPVEEKRTTFWPLERMWAYLTIKQLLDEKDARNKDGDDTAEGSPTQKALKLALKYSFVTPLTSLVVVKPNSTAAVDAESVEAGGAKFGAGYALPLVANSYAQSAMFSSRPMFAPQPQSYALAGSFGSSQPFYQPGTSGMPGIPGMSQGFSPQSPMYQSDLQDRFVGANPQSLFGAPSYASSSAFKSGLQAFGGSPLAFRPLTTTFPYPRHTYPPPVTAAYPQPVFDMPSSALSNRALLLSPASASMTTFSGRRRLRPMSRIAYSQPDSAPVALPGKPQPLWLSPAAAVGFFGPSNDQHSQGRPDIAYNRDRRPASADASQHSSPQFLSLPPSSVGLALYNRFGPIDRADSVSFIPPAQPAAGQYVGISDISGGSFGGSAVGAAAPQASFDTISDPNPYSVPEIIRFHAEEESEPFTTSDDEDTVQSLPVSTTPRQQLETEQTTEVKEIIPAKNEPAKPTKADRLKSYNLEAFPWLQEYLVDGEDAFSIPSTSTKPAKKYLLKNKTKTPSAADSAPVEPPCQFAEGVPGTCRYLTDCKDLSTVFKDLPTFLARACDAGNGLAGICYKLELP